MKHTVLIKERMVYTMAKTFEVEVTVPEGLKEGDTFKVQVEVPRVPRKPRGQLAGIALVDMSDEQLKREIINSKSVLYKAKQRGASDETIAVNQARVDAALAEKAKRQGIAATNEVATATDGDANADEQVYNEETASEM